ncbi:hypothetical protein B0H14DRAFT_1237307 [Mycena olivaceomarginata]|nr:hypothetical protein B0H14DRAFT_1237307 [Mycena olivaceomarginata]
MFVEITTVNFTTGVSDLELVSRAPETSFDFARIDCAVCGEIVAVYLSWTQVLFINWRTRSRILVSTSKESSQMAVIPGYLILMMAAPRGEHRLAFSPFASFRFWEPNSSLEAPSTHVPVAKLPFFSAIGKPISLTSQPPGRKVENLLLRRSIWVHESPLQQGRYKIWLHTWFNVAPALCSFECVKRDAGLSWRFLSTTHMPMHIYPKRMSLSGHTLGYCRGHRGLRIIPPVPTNKESACRELVEFPGRAPFIHLSSFSGNLTYSTDKEVVVVYYD